MKASVFRAAFQSRLIPLLGLLLTCAPAAFAQGLVYFNNRVTGVVDARVTWLAEQGIGAGYTAQLFGAPEGTPVVKLTPLFPTTTFRTSSAASQGYINPVVVEVPGVAPGQRATLVMRVFPTGGIFELPYGGESNQIIVTLGGDILPPANLEGLRPFPCCIPERSTLTFGALAVLATLGGYAQ